MMECLLSFPNDSNSSDCSSTDASKSLNGSIILFLLGFRYNFNTWRDTWSKLHIRPFHVIFYKKNYFRKRRVKFATYILTWVKTSLNIGRHINFEKVHF